MAYRCINAFSFAGRTVAGGELVDDDDAILTTHASHFSAVAQPSRSDETATADAPRAKRGPGRPRKDAPAAPVELKAEGDTATAAVE